uniref:Uncharacterized protein n=1 Tax=Kwoniella bestiolae CBS 10118 TaxID=1296100 RepID=A0A1B9G901_9TREE|nr:hypothetical protein I302_02302 [Kwoniella bestiolae CBS 10118]OCF27460.1 hypothetical protein I302_02302 [Kwoniella bestiolae CBS 10118]
MSTNSPSSSSPTPSSFNPLQRAHTLSLQASTLLRPALVPISSLKAALVSYQEAIQLYERAQQDAADKGSDEVNTLKMLVIQHRKLLKDVERRISIAQKDQFAAISVPPTRQSIDSTARPAQRRLVSESAASRSEGISVPSTFGLTGIPPSGIVNRTSIPPFSLRPAPNPPPPGEPSLSPLYSSSSTSSSTEESFIHFGSPPETLDPFSRFWGMLENMIEEVSGPVMFATAPVDAPPPTSDPTSTTKKEDKLSREKTITKKDKGKEKGKEKEKAEPEDSFYVVKNRRDRVGMGNTESTDEEDVGDAPTKTAEELLLENASLKTSLDALALHAESVDNTNKTLKKQLEEREKGLKVLMEGLKREAGRVKSVVGQSQLLSGSSINSSRIPALGLVGSTGGVSGKEDSSSKKRIKELEDELRSLRSENEKQKEQIGRYKERFEKIKQNAKAKKEAKLAATVQSDGNG